MCLQGEAIKANVKISLIKWQRPAGRIWCILSLKRKLVFQLRNWKTCPAGGSFNSQMKPLVQDWLNLSQDPLPLVTFSRDKSQACMLRMNIYKKKEFQSRHAWETAKGKRDLKWWKCRQQQCQIFQFKRSHNATFSMLITAGQVKVLKSQIKAAWVKPSLNSVWNESLRNSTIMPFFKRWKRDSCSLLNVS